MSNSTLSNRDRQAIEKLNTSMRLLLIFCCWRLYQEQPILVISAIVSIIGTLCSALLQYVPV